MIDWSRVGELREEIGPEDFSEVVDIFLEEVDAAIEALGDGSASLDEQLHFLKGSALNLGFAEFAELCQRGETEAASGKAAIDLQAVASCYQASRDTFVAHLSDAFAA
ncbi:Hpt domain-containing protein [Primorskyibacter sp. S187A]|uniref:Hpt domain-containing protein n=1 Tax=Primorskyibacter sp. S187A TaxID=3415130 RepID=UPI003C7E89AF